VSPEDDPCVECGHERWRHDESGWCEATDRRDGDCLCRNGWFEEDE
jgi:hypothetical protein